MFGVISDVIGGFGGSVPASMSCLLAYISSNSMELYVTGIAGAHTATCTPRHALAKGASLCCMLCAGTVRPFLQSDSLHGSAWELRLMRQLQRHYPDPQDWQRPITVAGVAGCILNQRRSPPTGTEEPLLRNISFRVPARKLGLIYGRSGAGKTTLLQLVAGLSTHTAGSISITETTGAPASPRSEHVELCRPHADSPASLRHVPCMSVACSISEGHSTSGASLHGQLCLLRLLVRLRGDWVQLACVHVTCCALLPAGLGAKHSMTSPTDRLSRTGLVFQFPERHFLASTLQQVTLSSQHSVASNILRPAVCSRRPAKPLKRLQKLWCQYWTRSQPYDGALTPEALGASCAPLMLGD